LVERNLAKVEVAGSSLVFRSKNNSIHHDGIFYFSVSIFARVAELVDAQDLKSCCPQRQYGSDSRPGHFPVSGNHCLPF
jgi:hypothetical protein